MSPTLHPCKHDSTSCSQINGDKENTNDSLPLDSRSFHINTIQPSLQDHFKCITRPSNDSHAKPSCTPILQNNKSHLDDTSGYKSTGTEHTTTTPSTRTYKIPPPRPSKATNVIETSANQQKQPTQAHPEPTPVRKSPLLPTPPAQSRQTFILRPSSNYRNQYHSQQCITGPSTVMNSQFHYQPHFTRPFQATTCNQQPPLLPNLIPGHQSTTATRSPVLTRPHPHTQ